MGILGYRVYTDGMPVPEEVKDPSGAVVFTGEEITSGQETFLRRGIQEYGTILGHGAYLGQDFTAEYLRMFSESVKQDLIDQGSTDPENDLIQLMRTNRYDENTGLLVFTPEQVRAFEKAEDYYGDFFGKPTTEHGLLPSLITDPQEVHDLTAFFAWTSWASAAERPGFSYSYTNNWPSEPRVANSPTGPMVVWSAVSLCALLGGIGLLFAVYGRW